MGPDGRNVAVAESTQIVSGIDVLLRLHLLWLVTGSLCGLVCAYEVARISSVPVSGIAASRQQRLPAHGLRDMDIGGDGDDGELEDELDQLAPLALQQPS